MSAGVILDFGDGEFEVCRFDPTGETMRVGSVSDNEDIRIKALDKDYIVEAAVIVKHLRSIKPILVSSIDKVLRENIVKVEGTAQ